MSLTINQLQETIRDRQNNDAYMVEKAVPWIAENQLDVEYMISKSINEQGICAIVMTPGLKFQGMQDDGVTMVFLVTDLVLQVTEQPMLNRARTNAATALDVCSRATGVLMQAYGTIMVPKTIKQTEVKGLLSSTATFSTSIMLTVPLATAEETGTL